MGSTVFGDEKTVIAALEAGALGYLLKDGSADYLVRSTLELLSHGSPISPAIARHLLKRLHGAPPAGGVDASASPEADPDAPSLSDREREVLEYLVKGFT